jgi:hypothetical protein
MLPLLVSLSLAASAGAATAAEPQRDVGCALLDVQLHPDDPIVQRGVFRNAFGRYVGGQHAAAVKAFTAARRGIAEKVEKLFHAPKTQKVDNARIRRFLQDTVTGKSPVMRVQGDDFVFVPTVLLAMADSLCKTGDVAAAVRALEPLAGDPDTRVAPARAIVAIEASQPEEALAILGEAADQDTWHVRAVRALALGRLGSLDEAWKQLDAARAGCVGEVQCGKVERVRRDLLEAGHRDEEGR